MSYAYESPSFWEYLWGDTWRPGMESLGRYMVLFIAALFLGLIVVGILDARSDRRFIRNCYARGGHVHYRHRSVPGPGIIVGNVVVPTSSTATTMTFAPGKEENCQRCQGEED